MDTFLPVILGSDENAYGNVRLFREAYGVRPLLVCTRRLTATLNSEIFDIEQVKDFDKDDVFVPSLLGILRKCHEKYEKILVVPCSDYYAGLLIRHYGEFEGLISNRFISVDLLEKLETKDRFYRLCDDYSLEYPKTLVVEPDDRKNAMEKIDFDFPIVVKPENSNAYEYLHCEFEGKKKVFFFKTKDEYLNVIREMDKTDYKGKLIIQEFIPGGDDSMRVINCYSGNDGKVKAMCLGQPILEEYSPNTLGNYAAIISRNDEKIYSVIKKFLEEIGYVGFSNFDMKYDRRNNRYLLFEINPRPGRSSFFVRSAGINMMKIMKEDVIDGTVSNCIYGKETALWTAVPKCVIRKYVSHRDLRNEATSLFDKKKKMRTLFCPDDMNMKRKLRISRYYLGYIKSYKKYFFRKDD